METEPLIEVINRAIHEHSALNTFVQVCVTGFHVSSDATQSIALSRRVAKTLRRPDPYPNEEDLQARLKEANIIEKFAKEQGTRGFPYLFSLATVRLWSILEVMADDLVVSLLRTSETLPSEGVVSNLTGPLLPFLSASTDERAEYLAVVLKEKLRATLKPGAARFEAMLEPFGLCGPIEESIRRVIFELSHVRNVIVHRNGIVDKRFIEACPWLGWKIGSAVILTQGHYSLYGIAADWYFIEVGNRIERAWGKGPEEDDLQLQEDLISHIKEKLASLPTGL